MFLLISEKLVQDRVPVHETPDPLYEEVRITPKLLSSVSCGTHVQLPFPAQGAQLGVARQ